MLETSFSFCNFTSLNNQSKNKVMKKKNVLLVLTEDSEVLVTTLKEYNEDEGSKYKMDYDFPVSLKDAKSYGNGCKEWEDVLDTFSDSKLFEIECEWGEGAMIIVSNK